MEIEVVQILFSEIAYETLQSATFHDSFGPVAIFSSSGGVFSPVFSIRE